MTVDFVAVLVYEGWKYLLLILIRNSHFVTVVWKSIVYCFCQHWCKLIANSSDFTVRCFCDVNRENFLFLAVPASFGHLSTAISHQNFT